MITLKVNGVLHQVDADVDTPLFRRVATASRARL